MSGVISSENDDADAIISVKETIGSDQVIHDWNRKRVAQLKSVSQNDGTCGSYCFGRLSLIMATCRVCRPMRQECAAILAHYNMDETSSLKVQNCRLRGLGVVKTGECE